MAERAIDGCWPQRLCTASSSMHFSKFQLLEITSRENAWSSHYFLWVSCRPLWECDDGLNGHLVWAFGLGLRGLCILYPGSITLSKPPLVTWKNKWDTGVEIKQTKCHFDWTQRFIASCPNPFQTEQAMRWIINHKMFPLCIWKYHRVIRTLTTQDSAHN